MAKDMYIIDTDTGVDDAMAILQMIGAKKEGKADLLCITAVNGNCSCENATRNICRLLDTVDVHDVPVYKGATEALVVPYSGPGYHGDDGFNDVQFDNEPDLTRVREGHAWDAISKLTKEHPGQITLIAIGPLTNVALAFKLDPALPARLKALYIMGGNIEGIGNTSIAAEFNFHADPEAASITLRLTRCPTYIASWELCLKYVKTSLQWRNQNIGPLKTAAADLINKLEQVWFDNWIWGEHWILCDQLAMTALLYPHSITRQSKHHAQVELNGTFTRGMMVLDQRHGVTVEPNVIILEELDVEVVQQAMFQALNQ